MTEPGLLPEVLEPLAWLVGDWAGEGRGEYPTIDDFGYREETSFGFVGKPYLVYSQRTWLTSDGSPSHMESGYLRPGSPDSPELVIARPSGIAEVLAGTLGDERVDFVTTTIGSTPTAKSITGIRYRFERRGNALWYSLDMAAVGHPMTSHCEATLLPA